MDWDCEEKSWIAAYGATRIIDIIPIFITVDQLVAFVNHANNAMKPAKITV